MTRVSKHSGTRAERHRPARSPRPAAPRGRLLVLACGVTVTLVAWGFLVYAAIEFGKDARAGQDTAWAFLAVATIGAAACLFATLLLGMKVFEVLAQRQLPEVVPETPPLEPALHHHVRSADKPEPKAKPASPAPTPGRRGRPPKVEGRRRKV